MKEDLSHDSKTHRTPWLFALNAMADTMSDDDRGYWEHEAKSLEKFLDWFDAEKSSE